MFIQFAGDDLVRGLGDEIGFFFGKLPEIAIDQRGCFFQDAEGPNKFGGHHVFADGEMDERAGGLRAVIAVHRDFDIAHAVGFRAGWNGF